FCVAACAAAMVSACVEPTAPPAPAELTGAALVERGEYLVNNIGGCNDCHTPMTPQGPDMARALQGGTLIFGPLIEMPWAPTAPALAGGPVGYTDEQFAQFLQTGARPDGSRPLPPMPPFRLNEEDARAMVAYIRTVPAAPVDAPEAPAQ
ncbi:MAG: cytochrome c, partial [Hyphomonadaceae bacterium]